MPELHVASGAAAPPDASLFRQRLLRVWNHKWLVVLVVLGLVAASYASIDYLRGERVAVELVQRADLLETVVASGHVESPYRVQIASQITGTVVSVAVREGETVRQGQPLIVLAADELRNAAAQAQATVAQADANVRQVNELTLAQALEAQRSAQASLLSAEQVFGRTSTLMAQGFVTRAYFDEVTRNRDVALTQVAMASAQVRSAQSGGSGLAAAAAALQQARAGSAVARSRLGYTTIFAPRDGILISRSVERGMVVTPGVTLMLLSPDGDMQIVLQIDERNLSRIVIGQTARISADAYPGQLFTATVSFINPGIDIARASATVKLTVGNPPAYLRQNMTVSVDIETARRAKALSLPGSAVHDALTAAPWVMVVEDGRAAPPGASGLAGQPADRDPGRPCIWRAGHPGDRRCGRRRQGPGITAMNTAIPFEWIAAVRFLREGRLQTAFIIVGITIGVAVIVFMSALISGLQVNFLNSVLTSSAQIQLLPLDQVARPLFTGGSVIEDATVQRPTQRIVSINQWQKVQDRVAQIPGVLTASPTMSGSALVTRGDASRAVRVAGIEPASYFQIIRVPQYLTAGKVTLANDEIIVGTDLATNLGAMLGDTVNVRAASGNSVVLRITGLFDVGNKAANEGISFVALRTAQSLLGQAGAVTTIEVRIADVYAAERLAVEIAAANPVKAESWIFTNAQFFTAISAQKSTNNVIRVFVGLSVAFGIAAVLVVSVIQRSKDIGILRAIGTTRGQILRIFLIQGGMLGLAGAIVGCAVGVGGLAWYHSLVRQADGSELFPLLVERQMIVVTLVLATITGLFSAMAPALRAARLDPVEAIRG